MAKPKPIEAPCIPAAVKMLGALCLMVAIGASLILALDHFALATPPGCGPASGCDHATRSAWGTIPGIHWPTSLLGVAYFSGLLAAWLASSRSIHPLLRITTWLGVAGSVVFLTVMLDHGFICKYCLATHIANFAFIGLLELGVRSCNKTGARSLAPLTAGALAFVVVTAGLAVVNAQTSAKRLARSEVERRQTTDAIIQATTRNAPTTQSATATVPIENAKPFTGRWRRGPENAPIRIVMFMDYQCEDCQQMEAQVASLLQRRTDVSLSVKHFPMSADCNPHLGGVNMHPNACWAARAAEAAGTLRGNDGFWQMHDWLFRNGGSFTDASFPASLQQLGYDPQQFIDTMMSNNTLRTVLEDIDEGSQLGLHFTPMIFINGVELRGFIGNPGALTRTVDDLVATNPAPGTAAQDHPARAADKYVQDWRVQPARSPAPDAAPHVIGSPTAKVQVIVWGDLQDKFTAELDRAVQGQIAAGRDVRYEFRQYPADQACNPSVQQTVYPLGCMAARAAEAAAAVGGNDGYWKMHNWLIAHQQPLNDGVLMQAAAESGLDPAALLAAMNAPAAATAVSNDVQSGAGMVVNGMIPTVYVNGKWVPRWKLEGDRILERIIDAAEHGQ